MDIELSYSGNYRGTIELVKHLKKLPTVPARGDHWQQAGWDLFVDGRLWSEGMDKLTIFLVDELDTATKRRRLIDNLIDAGWAEAGGQ